MYALVSIPERVWGVCDAFGPDELEESRLLGVSIPERVWGV